MNVPSKRLPVLVVDDDEDVRRTLGLVLRRAGFEVTMARGGKECLDRVREGFRGVILMDIMMPGLDGWGTVSAIVEGGWLPGNLICMLTACPSPVPAAEAIREYVFDYVVKPFDVEELVGVVELASAQLMP